MGTPSTATGRAQETEVSARNTVVAVYLSGPLRGRSVRIEGATLYLSKDSGGPLTPQEAGESEHAATLIRTAAGYQLIASQRHVVWVNGEPVGVRDLESGDMVEFEGGPVLRFRFDPPERSSAASSDRGEAAPREATPAWASAREWWRARATKAWRRTRARVLLVLAILIGAIAFQSLQTQDLERQLVREQERVSGLAELLHKLEGQTLRRGDLDALREELSKGLVDTGARVRALEAGSAAASQIIARSSGSVAFVQGSFGFEDPATKRPLRFAVTKQGSPLRSPNGRPLVTLEGSGPLVKVRFAGTAFVINREGVLLTNRHVALPWEDEPLLPAIRELGLEPVMQRMRGYVSGTSEPFEMRFLGASDTHDVAALQGDSAARTMEPVLLSSDPPTPGETAILLGFPTGIRALLARAGDAFVKELSRQPDRDDDEIAHQLALAGMVKPLASRGIVGQVSGEAIVYDAQTATGGSGGPVLNLKGEVIAINRAMVAEFGGSNIGVPARHAFDLLQRLKISPAERSASNAR
jgi:serine protease Do